jgi:CTP:molybdopterin cytidylyltransferase MocA
MAITEETQGIRAVVNRHQERTHRLEVETAEVLWDLNTPEQYQAALQG